MGYGCILKVELIGLDDGLVVVYGRQGVKMGPGFWLDQIQTRSYHLRRGIKENEGWDGLESQSKLGEVS